MEPSQPTDPTGGAGAERPSKKTVKDIATRIVATAVSGAIAAPLTAVSLDFAVWKAYALAGATAVINLGYRLAQRWLAQNPE